ncbi:hypothetical protein J2857_003630 [Neorhizobium galegae]|uniref:hypothetical protein n=1 Tax=Neorhizobium galegae TaxID=399 RepID=UPI001AE7D3BA|nr:hypothetical protein [Neorhizobium galegae]MBP2560861.1 hypothetical protein [Neorhizobium galegae]
MSDVEYPLIRIDELTPEVLPSRTHVLPVMKDGVATLMSVGQILDLIIGTAPGVLDTIEELAAAFGNDPNAIANLTTLINARLAKAGGTMSGNLDMASHLLSNATLVSALMADPTNNTKRLQLVLSAIANATTQSLIMPGRDVDLKRVPTVDIYVSSDLTITSGGAISLSHGMGVKPDLVIVELVNQTTEGGYSAGEATPIGYFGYVASGAAVGIGGAVSATTIDGRYSNQANVFFINRKDTGANIALTNSSWKMRLTAVRFWR